MKTWGWINWAAVAIAAVTIVVGIGTLILIHVDPGVRLGINDQGQVYVADVLPYSQASLGWRMAIIGNNGTAKYDGTTALRPGMVVVALNHRPLISLPQLVYGPAPSADPVTGYQPDPPVIGVQPERPTSVVAAAELSALVGEPIRQVEAVDPSTLAAWDPSTSVSINFESTFDYTGGSLYGRRVLVVAVGGIAALFLVAWWLASGRAGSGLQRIAVPAALAVAGPLILAPLETSISLAGWAGYPLLMPITLVPLGLSLLARIEVQWVRVLAGLAAVALGAAAVAVGLERLSDGLAREESFLISVLGAGVSALPGLAAAFGRQSATSTPDGDTARSQRVVRGATYAVLGFTPLFAVQTAIGPYWGVLPIWVAVVWVAGRFTVRPLTRLANRAQLQRDLVVAATEAERARVAADIHDDALQELTLLVRRLDAAGDTEGADLARGVSERLRAICGDLRLPILDDLGIGPALDWLVLRIERLAGGEVRLEQADGSRPPADVELAFFRVAQEALSNAVKHGRPPIVVRYRSADGFASLSIDDAGAGIATDARVTAEADGHHFGLLNMAQRAEAIGAILDVRRWPAGGTHVGLEWRAR
jgi:signal transduction histidine kinase